MGCVYAKPLMDSRHRGLAKLKSENGYVSGRYVGPRRSTHQLLPAKDSGGFNRPELKNNNAFKVAPGRYSVGERIDQERKLITKESKKEIVIHGAGSDNNIPQSQRPKVSNSAAEEDVVDGWPKWLTNNISKDALAGLVPKSAESYEKLDKVGEGTYSNVYKARDKDTGKIVALKKVRFDTSEPESVKFMAREIMILRKLDHPNIVKLEGLATSRMQYSLYLVFDYMYSDLTRIISRPSPAERLTEPQVKCYMYQLLSGLKHCHERGILHRDIKGSNLLIDKNGMLKIADFGLANYFNPEKKRPLTNRVVTLWYRAPELLLGATDYGVGIDLWSAGCLLAEMFAGKPIMPGRTEVEQLHKIFKLCGTPSEEYWKRVKLPTTFRPPQAYRSRIREAFKDFPASSIGLLKILLSLDPAKRGYVASALQNEFFQTSPLACDLSGLPTVYKEEDELNANAEQKKNSKMRQRSRTQRERMRKDKPSGKLKRDSASSKEFQEERKSADVIVHSQEPGSSTASTSSTVKSSRQEWISSPSPYPVISSPRRMVSPSTEAHPNATKNIKNLPPLANSKRRTTNFNYNNENGHMYRLNQVERSVSSRDFGKVDQKKLYRFHAVDY